jgi:ribonuclease R
MHELASVLRKRRQERGSLDFDVDEAYIGFDGDGQVTSVEVAVRRAAERMIEEFMIAANETVAKHIYNSGSPFIYRVHEKPAQEKMEEFKAFIKVFGLSLHGSMRNINPGALSGILQRTEGKEYENVVKKAMLRSMSKAFYSSDCMGHFGLGLKYYCHFTAPIRRYPDLMAHRIVKESLAGFIKNKRKRALTKKTAKIAYLSSIAERKALEIEREAEKIKKAEYMSRRIGEVFNGVISGVAHFGIFVELPTTIEGLVSADHINWDFKTFTIGDKLTVKVQSVDVDRGYIDFTVCAQ